LPASISAAACDCSYQTRGDLNDDGWVDSTDSVWLAHLLAGNIDSGPGGVEQPACADINLDCQVNARDLLDYQRVLAEPVSGSHAGRFATYEGSKTCIACHLEQVQQVHASGHYQWQGPTPDVVGSETGFSGKYGTINDFCTYPNFSWLSKLTNVDGVQVDGGCARCHLGMGAKPTVEATQEQLENIDCLLCHSNTYKRTLTMTSAGYRFVPDAAKMPVSILQAVSDIRMPGRDACLNCHTKSGGGNNFKRGDLEEAHRNPTADFDVHMASVQSGGAGLVCTDCHFVSEHKIAGRGADLRPRELSPRPDCIQCHSPAPHSTTRLNNHAARIHCTSCHIPEYAKIAPTDLYRDFSQPGDLDETTRLFEPHMLKAAHVVPEYRFFNGKTVFYDFGEPVFRGDDGLVLMAGPQGDVNDPTAKIYPFKYHNAMMATHTPTDRLIPVKMGILFQTGNAEQAIITGANEIGWGYSGHDFVETERYLGLFHEVSPKEQALGCSSCHDGGTRLDFDSLGYTPRTVNASNGRAF